MATLAIHAFAAIGAAFASWVIVDSLERAHDAWRALMDEKDSSL